PEPPAPPDPPLADVPPCAVPALAPLPLPPPTPPPSANEPPPEPLPPQATALTTAAKPNSWRSSSMRRPGVYAGRRPFLPSSWHSCSAMRGLGRGMCAALVCAATASAQTPPTAQFPT